MDWYAPPMRGNICIPQIEISTPCKQTATGDEESLKWHRKVKCCSLQSVKMFSWTGEMAQKTRELSPKADNFNFLRETLTWQKERTQSRKLSSDFYICAMTLCAMLTHILQSLKCKVLMVYN